MQHKISKHSFKKYLFSITFIFLLLSFNFEISFNSKSFRETKYEYFKKLYSQFKNIGENFGRRKIITEEDIKSSFEHRKKVMDLGSEFDKTK